MEASNSGNCLAAPDGTHGVIRTVETPKMPTVAIKECADTHISEQVCLSVLHRYGSKSFTFCLFPTVTVTGYPVRLAEWDLNVRGALWHSCI